MPSTVESFRLIIPVPPRFGIDILSLFTYTSGYRWWVGSLQMISIVKETKRCIRPRTATSIDLIYFCDHKS